MRPAASRRAGAPAARPATGSAGRPPRAAPAPSPCGSRPHTPSRRPGRRGARHAVLHHQAAPGGTPSAAAAARNTSGAGLPAARRRRCAAAPTSGASPVRANFTAISSCEELRRDAERQPQRRDRRQRVGAPGIASTRAPARRSAWRSTARPSPPAPAGPIAPRPPAACRRAAADEQRAALRLRHRPAQRGDLRAPPRG